MDQRDSFSLKVSVCGCCNHVPSLGMDDPRFHRLPDGADGIDSALLFLCLCVADGVAWAMTRLVTLCNFAFGSVAWPGLRLLSVVDLFSNSSFGDNIFNVDCAPC